MQATGRKPTRRDSLRDFLPPRFNSTFPLTRRVRRVSASPACRHARPAPRTCPAHRSAPVPPQPACRAVRRPASASHVGPSLRPAHRANPPVCSPHRLPVERRSFVSVTVADFRLSVALETWSSAHSGKWGQLTPWKYEYTTCYEIGNNHSL